MTQVNSGSSNGITLWAMELGEEQRGLVTCVPNAPTSTTSIQVSLNVNSFINPLQLLSFQFLSRGCRLSLQWYHGIKVSQHFINRMSCFRGYSSGKKHPQKHVPDFNQIISQGHILPKSQEVPASATSFSSRNCNDIMIFRKCYCSWSGVSISLSQ